MGLKTIYLYQQPILSRLASIVRYTLLICSLSISLQCVAGEPLRKKHKTFYPNGKIKLKGQFKRGKKHGNWFYFNEKGMMVKRERYKAGELFTSYTYNDKGKLATIIDKEGKITNKPGCGCQ
ncbi:MAG: hypothetical protein EAY81_04835 [Bacteroidetes bacterium]|nr:MAG: hypothetical protein EAY81_04835 [Bacteroidota bacterium]